MMIGGLLLSAVFAWLALADVHWADLRAALALARLWLALPFVLLLVAFYWLKTLRWRMLLEPAASLPAAALAPALMVGFAANNLLPAHLGELVRVYLLGRERGLARSAVLASVVLERVFDMLAVLALTFLALASGNALGDELRLAGAFLALVVVLVLVPAAVLVFRAEWFRRLAAPLLAPLPPRWRARIDGQLAALAAGFGALRARHRLPAILANSLAQWLLMASCVWLAVIAFGIAVPWVAPVIILVLIVAAITLPSSPGYVGAIEYCFVLGLKAYGVSASLALSAALFYHALSWCFLACAGAVFLRRYGLGWRSLRRAAAQS